MPRDTDKLLNSLDRNVASDGDMNTNRPLILQAFTLPTTLNCRIYSLKLDITPLPRTKLLPLALVSET